MKKPALLLLVLCLVLSAAPLPFRAAAAEADLVRYAIDNADLSRGLEGWDTGDASKFKAQKYLTLKPGAALWRPIPITGAGSAPAAGDVVHAKATAMLDSGVTVDGNVLIRLNAGSVLAEINDLSGVPRGQQAELASKAIEKNGAIPAGQSDLWVEIHNDTPGTIELYGLEVWGEAGGSGGAAKTYAAYDFSAGMEGWESNGADKSYLSASLVMQPGAAAWRSVPFGDGAAAPQPGDKVRASAELFVPSGVNRTDGVFVRVHDAKGSQADINDIADTPRDAWFKAADSSRLNGGILHDDAAEIWIELHNETDRPVRIRNVDITAEREESAAKFDVNGDGRVDAKDEQALADLIKRGKQDLRFDYDGDGQLTPKDSSYLRKYGLKRPDEVYLNLKHFNFMNEKVTIGGVPMFITHLYAEPIDRSDPSKGYGWVGDPQEGLAAVDDVSRAVIVYAEHYRTYRDAYSYDMIKRGLEFLMWMQHDDGDFDNFVVRDADGTIHPKDSHSSQKSFSWWAARAYEAMGTALPLLGKEDKALANRVTVRLNLSLKRLQEKTDPLYGQFDESSGVKVAKWLLEGDVWVSSIAVDALRAHYQAVNDSSAKKAILESVRKLGEGIYLARGGTSFRDFPYGGILHHTVGMTNPDLWEEWGSIQVRALAFAGQMTGNPAWVEAAETAADSFLSDLLISGRAENLHPNKKPYPQINYGTASYVDNLLALYEVTGKKKYAQLAGIAGSWWTGNNVRQVPMFDQRNGYAYDGLTDRDVNINSGGESVDEALRALLRTQENADARTYLQATTVSAVKAQTLEIEELYRGSAPPDAEMALPSGGLNDPDAALRKQNPDSGTDEAAIYEDAKQVGAGTEIYPGWKGGQAIFVASSGYNNMRLFDGGTIQAELQADGAEGHFKPGETVKLQFDARVEFDTALSAEVLAVDSAGHETVVADANDMSYHARTWYSGDGAVKTTPRGAIPAGTAKLIVRFRVSADNPNPHEGYASIAAAKLFKMSVPEVRYANPDVSGGGYVEMPAGQEKSFKVNVPAAGLYDVMLSSVATGNAGSAAPRVSIGFDGQAPALIDLPAAPAGRVALKRVASVSLTAGEHELRLKNPSGDRSAGLDALVLYPVESGITVATPDGKKTAVIRDSVSGTLFVGSPDAAAVRDRISVAAQLQAGRGAGSKAAVTGKVTDALGKPVSGRKVSVRADGVAGTAFTAKDGTFSLQLAVPKAASPDGIRVTASPASGEGTAWILRE
ncbi:hypothetical protein [Cohnella caldifontis]|uniref:hypothetical protein n=1 Tax=Cohnella caldifontis TaxID=3027471 RepID=UPI0023EDD65B|nr:hypothetical protein [Cohnella sp. YIM B05605]